MPPETVDCARVKAVLVRALRLEGLAPEAIGDEQPLFGSAAASGDGVGAAETLGLDSVDALELVVALESEFGIDIASEDVGRERFAHVRALVELVNEALARRAPNAGELGRG
jgi:acyl carrier protein